MDTTIIVFDHSSDTIQQYDLEKLHRHSGPQIFPFQSELYNLWSSFGSKIL